MAENMSILTHDTDETTHKWDICKASKRCRNTEKGETIFYPGHSLIVTSPLESRLHQQSGQVVLMPSHNSLVHLSPPDLASTSEISALSTRVSIQLKSENSEV